MMVLDEFGTSFIPGYILNSTFALLIRNLIRTCQQFDDRLRASISA